MWSMAKPLTGKQQQLSQEQVRAFKMAYLLGAKDALRICEADTGGELDGAAAIELFHSLDRQLDRYAVEATEPKARTAEPKKKASANQEKYRGGDRWKVVTN